MSALWWLRKLVFSYGSTPSVCGSEDVLINKLMKKKTGCLHSKYSLTHSSYKSWTDKLNDGSGTFAYIYNDEKNDMSLKDIVARNFTCCKNEVRHNNINISSYVSTYIATKQVISDTSESDELKPLVDAHVIDGLNASEDESESNISHDGHVNDGPNASEDESESNDAHVNDGCNVSEDESEINISHDAHVHDGCNVSEDKSEINISHDVQVNGGPNASEDKSASNINLDAHVNGGLNTSEDESKSNRTNDTLDVSSEDKSGRKVTLMEGSVNPSNAITSQGFNTQESFHPSDVVSNQSTPMEDSFHTSNVSSNRSAHMEGSFFTSDVTSSQSRMDVSLNSSHLATNGGSYFSTFSTEGGDTSMEPVKGSIYSSSNMSVEVSFNAVTNRDSFKSTSSQSDRMEDSLNSSHLATNGDSYLSTLSTEGGDTSMEPVKGSIDSSSDMLLEVSSNAARNGDSPKALSALPAAKDPSLERHLLPTMIAGPFGKAFKILKYLGGGSFGSVFKAQSIVIKEDVVVKFVVRKHIPLPDEVTIMQKLSHPNVVEFRRVFVNMNYIQVVMAQHGNISIALDAYRSKLSSISENMLAYFSNQMLEGLKYVHSQSIAHMDIKPANIIINEKLELKLIDFGVSMKVSLDKKYDSFGTSQYMAPEMHFGTGYYGPEVDMWAIGVTIYRLYTTQYPFNYDRQKKLRLKRGEMYKPIQCSQKLHKFFTKLFDRNGMTRMSAKDALKHQWQKKVAAPSFVHAEYYNQFNLP